MLEALNPLVEPFAFVDADLRLERQVGNDQWITYWEVGDQAAVAAQLQLAQFARKKSAMIEQPGQTVHYPGGGTQSFATELDSCKILFELRLMIVVCAARSCRASSEPKLLKACAHLVRQLERVDIQRFDNARVKTGHDGHRAGLSRPWLLAQQAWAISLHSILHCAGTARISRIAARLQRP